MGLIIVKRKRRKKKPCNKEMFKTDTNLLLVPLPFKEPFVNVLGVADASKSSKAGVCPCNEDI
jgi:hypothetical protein